MSWSTDIIFFNHADNDEQAVNLIIFLRMWRLIRIIHAIAVSARAPVEHKLEQELEAHHITEARLDKLFDYTHQLEEEIQDLRDLLQNLIPQLPTTKLKKIGTLTLNNRFKSNKVGSKDEL